MSRTKRSLSKAEIIRRRTDIESLMSVSRRKGVPSIALKCRPNMCRFHRVLVLPVRAKGKRSAVRRNRQKRVGRELFRRLKPMYAVQGQDIALFIYPDAVEINFVRLFESCRSLFRRCNLLGEYGR